VNLYEEIDAKLEWAFLGEEEEPEPPGPVDIVHDWCEQFKDLFPTPW